MMKKLRMILTVLLVLVLTGCGAVKYEITGGFSKMTVKVHNVDDQAYGESQEFSTKGNITIEPELKKGSLQIEFAEVVNWASADEPDNYEVIAIAKTVTVTGNEKQEIEIPSGDYILQMTAIGNTDSTVIINH